MRFGSMLRVLFLVALTLSTATRAQDAAPDDVPLVVRDAQGADGASLGPGWWLSNSRMAKVGTRLRDCQDMESELTRLKSTPPAEVNAEVPPLLPFGFWAGMVVGVVLSGAAVVAVSRLAK